MTLHDCIIRVVCVPLSLCLVSFYGCDSFRHRYDKLKDAMLLEEWDLSALQHCELLLWYSSEGEPRLIYGTQIDDEKNGVLYMRWNTTTEMLEVFHVSDSRDASATVPYRLKGMLRKQGPIQTTGNPHVIACGAANEGLIYCRVTPTVAHDP